MYLNVTFVDFLWRMREAFGYTLLLTCLLIISHEHR